MSWVNKDTEIYCSFAKNAGNTGCQMMNSAFYYHKLNKIYKSFSVENIEEAIQAVKTLNIKGFAITMPYKKEVLEFVDDMEEEVRNIGAANTVINDDGYLRAYNTDFLAAKKYLKQYKDLLYTKDFYILGDGGYAAAVKTAVLSYGVTPTTINRDNWTQLLEIKDSIVYNCTPVEDIKKQINDNNTFIDCIVTTKSGHELAKLQASHQYKLYTQLEFPF